MSSDEPRDLPHLRRLLEHMAWADRRILSHLNEHPTAWEGEAGRLFAHLLAAERVWLLRLTGGDATAQPIWPVLTLDEMDGLARDNAAEYARFLSGLTRDAQQTEIAYTNSSGTTFHTAVADVLLHVALHGSYHRGQIAAAARRDGAPPVNTDFITFVREGSGAMPAGAGR